MPYLAPEISMSSPIRLPRYHRGAIETLTSPLASRYPAGNCCNSSGRRACFDEFAPRFALAENGVFHVMEHLEKLLPTQGSRPLGRLF